jgi:hypothetical protein
MLHIFSEVFNSNLQCFFFGDFNSELLEPTAKLKLKARTTPICINKCT